MISNLICSWALIAAVPCSARAQCYERLEELCQCGSAKPLLDVLDSLEQSMGLDTAISCSAEEMLARELVADYWTRHLSLTWMTTSKKRQRMELWLVTGKDHIVQWCIASGDKVRDVRIDTTLFERMNTVFRTVYERELEPWELFQSLTTRYGKVCGYAGAPPEERSLLEDMVAKHDVQGLNKWLGSPTAELQLYAFEGLLRMRADGYMLTPFQERCIKTIRKKKGAVSTCSGCIVSKSQIASVLSETDR